MSGVTAIFFICTSDLWPPTGSMIQSENPTSAGNLRGRRALQDFRLPQASNADDQRKPGVDCSEGGWKTRRPTK